MKSDFFEITYAAHTGVCTFLLDAGGICRRIVMAPRSRRSRGLAHTASRCIGLQYVASLDPGAPGCMIDRPRSGAAMLFARVDENGRVSLVRTGLVTTFETIRREPEPVEDLFDDASVETSAPLVPRPFARSAPEYIESSNRSMHVHADSELDEDDLEIDDSDEDMATSEYTAPNVRPRPVWQQTLPSEANHPVTLREPPPFDWEEDTPTSRPIPTPRSSDWVTRESAKKAEDPRIASRRRR